MRRFIARELWREWHALGTVKDIPGAVRSELARLGVSRQLLERWRLVQIAHSRVAVLSDQDVEIRLSRILAQHEERMIHAVLNLLPFLLGLYAALLQ